MTRKKAKDTHQGRDIPKPGFRVSARELVEFAYFQEDILPTAGMEEMQAGTRAHKARQQAQAGEVERSISQSREMMGERITLYGRMDAFTPGDIPFVEEMKLGRRAQALGGPHPAHRAQAVVYAALVARELGVEAVRFSVTYVDEDGGIVAGFEEQLGAAALEAELEALLHPYMSFLISEKRHREQRDRSIAALGFPFPTYRAGQRELAAQVYTAITRKRRLFASLPTGTGKSAAVLFPALKALGEGKTGKLLYLTARTTARQSPLQALAQMLEMGLKARVMTLSAKEKMCAGFSRCHPEDCPRAKGHYVRQISALEEMLAQEGLWTDGAITGMADKHALCPFEFALALTELADVALMDMNYAFDPFAQLKRLFLGRKDFTLLVDEAHHTVERVRENLSGALDSAMLRQCRARFGKAVGRKHPYYGALGKVIAELRALGEADSENGEERLASLPETLVKAVEVLCMAAYGLLGAPVPSGEAMGDCSTVLRLCAPFLYAAERLDEDYAILLTRHGKERAVELYCLLPAKEIARVTKGLRGTVFFSATMQPLAANKQLLGGAEEDACFALPSPFPPEHLAVVRRRVNTRYKYREHSAGEVARSIAEAVMSREGKYIAYFSSYAYLRMVCRLLEDMEIPPLLVQQSEMDEGERQRFLEAFTQDEEPKLGLCVLGSLFSEGIDLPGEQLVGVMVVGVGLPVPTARLKAVQACYGKHFGDGFAFACRIPGMQKVLQAAGRVIRSEEDRGLVLLLDERYYDREYERLLPQEWLLHNESIEAAVRQIKEGTQG